MRCVRVCEGECEGRCVRVCKVDVCGVEMECERGARGVCSQVWCVRCVCM